MSGLIGLAIIGIWLMVLVPMWLNRHESDEASRSMDSFSTAMRVLSRRPPGRASRGRGLVHMSRRDWEVTVDDNPNDAGRRVVARRAILRNGSAGRARLLARRRRILIVTFGLLLALLITCVMGVTSWWYELAAALLVAGFAVHLRTEAIQAEQIRRQRRARAARAAASGAWVSSSMQSDHRSPVTHSTLLDDDVVPAVQLAQGSAVGTENGSRWEPVPVPLPTYVSKPVVQRVASLAPRADVDATRTIDLTRPGEWTSAQTPTDTDVEIDHRHLLLDETGSARLAASVGAPPSPYGATGSADDDELDVILARRRAVGD